MSRTLAGKIQRVGLGVVVLGLLLAIIPTVFLGVPGSCEGDCATGSGPFIYMGILISIAGILLTTIVWIGNRAYLRVST